MTTHSKFSSILASVMVMTLALPGGAWAGGGRYENGGHDYGHQKKGQYSSHYNSHYNNHYKSGNYYRGGRYYYPNNHGYKSCGNNKSHHHNNKITTTTNCGLACWAAALSVIPSAIYIRATDLSSRYLPLPDPGLA